MMKAVIGIDTSCYTTSCAAVAEDGKVIASCRKLLPVAAGQRGLRQSEAVFCHVRQLPEVILQLSRQLHDVTITAVCASSTPRDDESSYMPVFQVGCGQAKSLAAMLDVPCFTTTHQRGHIAAARLDSGLPSGDTLALHLSGGTTELLAVQNGSLQLIGGTLDLHAGQLVDRAGVAMGLPFPAGPSLETLAVRGHASSLLPVSLEGDGLFCHLSGAEAQVQRWLSAQQMSKEDIAREIYDFLARTIARILEAGMKSTGIRQALIAGGVASSALFREMLRARVAKRTPDLLVCFGKPEFSGDNAAGVAMIGLQKLNKLSSLRIRSFQDGDFPSMEALYAASRAEELRYAQLAEAYQPLRVAAGRQDLFSCEIAVAEWNGEIVGFIAWDEEELTWLYVGTPHQRQGIGRALTEYAVQRMPADQAVSVQVLVGNTPAKKLYESCGFVYQETMCGNLHGMERLEASVWCMELPRRRQY